MFDEDKLVGKKVDNAIRKVFSCAWDILDNSDGTGNEIIENFNDNILYYSNLSGFFGNINKKVDGFTNSINTTLVNCSTKQGAFTSYGLRINGKNPLFISSDSSSASGLNKMLNKYQKNKSNMFTNVMNYVDKYNEKLLTELVQTCMKRKVMGIGLDNFATVDKIVKYTAVGTAGSAGIVGAANVANSSLTALNSYAATNTAMGLNAMIAEGTLIPGMAATTEVATVSTALAPVATGSTSVAVVGTTELATAGTALETVATGSTAAASTGFFATALTVAGLGVAGAAIVLAPLAYEVVRKTKKRVNDFAAAVDDLASVMEEYHNSFYCNTLSYSELKYDDSNKAGKTVYNKFALECARNYLVCSLSDFSSYKYDSIVKLCDRFKQFLCCSNNENVETLIENFCYYKSGIVSFEGIVRYINNITSNINVIITNFDKADSNIKKDTQKINYTTQQLAEQVIRGDWGVGNERKIKLETAGYDYDLIQDRVNKILLGTNATITVTTNSLVNKVIKDSDKTTSTDKNIKYRINDTLDLEKQRKEYLQKLEVLERDRDATIKKLREQQEKEILILRQQQEEKMKQLKQKQEKEIERLKKEQLEQIEKIKQDSNKEIEKLKQQYSVVQNKPIINDKVTVNKTIQPNVNNVTDNSTVTEDSAVIDDTKLLDSDNKDTIPNTNKKPTITTTTTNKVTQTNDKSSNSGIVGAVLGIGALGAAGVVGARYVKKKKENETYTDDENYFSNDEEFSQIKENDDNESTSKYQAGSINSLVLDDDSDIDMTNTSDISSDTLDFE